MHPLKRIAIKLIIGLVVYTAIYYVLGLMLQQYEITFDTFWRFTSSLQLLGYGLIFLLAVISVILPYPTTMTIALSSILYGPIITFLLMYTGSIAGAAINFVIVRKLGRNWVMRRSPDVMVIINDNMRKIGFQALVFFRLFPLFPFDIVSYGAAVTQVKFRNFILSAAIGYLPSVLVYTLMGARIEFEYSLIVLLSTGLAFVLLLIVLRGTYLFGKKLKLNQLEGEVDNDSNAKDPDEIEN